MSVVVGNAGDIVVGARVVVVSGSVLKAVVEVGVVEDVEAVAPIVVELPAVASGGAAEQETMSKAAPTAVKRGKETVRTA